MTKENDALKARIAELEAEKLAVDFALDGQDPAERADLKLARLKVSRATLADLSDDKDKRIEELEALVQKLASDPDYTAAYVAGVADQKATIAELEKMIDNMTAHIRIDPDE